MLHGPPRLSAPLSAPPYVVSIGPPLLSHCHRHRRAAALQQSRATPAATGSSHQHHPEPKTRGNGASGLAGPQWCGTAAPSSGTTDTQPCTRHRRTEEAPFLARASQVYHQPGAPFRTLGWLWWWARDACLNECHSLVMPLVTRRCAGWNARTPYSIPYACL